MANALPSDPIASDLTRFAPSEKRARFLDERMRGRLAASLEHIFFECEGTIPLPSARARADCLARIRSGSVGAQIFGAYYDLVFKISDDEFDTATVLLEEIVHCQHHGQDIHVAALPDPKTDAPAERCVRLLDTDPSMRFSMIAPPEPLAVQYEKEIPAALALIELADPELRREVDALLTDIILAVPPPEEADLEFDGASSFMLWGGIVLNIARQRSRLELAQLIVHESAHNLLFGLSMDGPLLSGAVGELFASPIREDRRPMDGVYHATFVLARMHYLCERLLKAGALSGDEKAKCLASLEENRANFLNGWETVQAGADMTEKGSAILRAAHDYVTD